MCPALILASKRKHRVKGRILSLTSSTTPRNGTRYLGAFDGMTQLAPKGLFKRSNTLASQRERDKVKFKSRTVVVGKLKQTNEVKFKVNKFVSHPKKARLPP
jgi:hypothetical protein